MTHEDHSATVLSNVLHFAQAFSLELGVSNCQHLVNDQNFGEIHDLVELGFDLRPAHPKDRTIEINVLLPRQILMETSSDLQQAGDASANRCPATCWLSDPAKNFQQRALPRPVSADDAQD